MKAIYGYEVLTWVDYSATPDNDKGENYTVPNKMSVYLEDELVGHAIKRWSLSQHTLMLDFHFFREPDETILELTPELVWDIKKIGKVVTRINLNNHMDMSKKNLSQKIKSLQSHVLSSYNQTCDCGAAYSESPLFHADYCNIAKNTGKEPEPRR